jgi:uncharacterized protein DUF4337
MEEIEVPTEHLHEEIQEKAEEKREKWTLYVALSTAFMAVLAAVAGLLAGHHANEALVERVKASDAWNFYQAKNLKQEIAVNTDRILQAVLPGRGVAPGQAVVAGKAGKPMAPFEGDHSADIARYEKEKADIKKQAEEAGKASESHLAKHVPLASAVTAFQIAIAISAIAILTRRKVLWYAGLGLTAIGIAFLLVGNIP